MKAALIFLACAVFVFFLAFARPTVQFRVSNISEIDKPTKIEIAVDRKPVFNGVVDDYSSNFKIKLSKGSHYILVKGDNGEIVQTQVFNVTGKTRIDIRYKASYTIDPKTQKPIGDNSLSREISLSVADWGYPNNDVYVEAPRKKRQ